MKLSSLHEICFLDAGNETICIYRACHLLACLFSSCILIPRPDSRRAVPYLLAPQFLLTYYYLTLHSFVHFRAMFVLFIATPLLLFFSPAAGASEPFHPSPYERTISTMQNQPSPGTPGDNAAVNQLNKLATEFTARYICRITVKT